MPTREVVASPSSTPLSAAEVSEPLPTTSQQIPTETTDIAQKDDTVTQRINDLSELPYDPVEHVEVAYFHLTQRCESCIKAERLTRKTLDTYFADQLQSGDISLVVVDIQDPQNAALAEKYDAFAPSLYLGILKGGIEYTLAVEDIWLILSDEPKFMASLHRTIDSIYYEGE